MTRRLFKIKGVVQHYSWGGYEFIPRLLDIENTAQKPFAEYWLGAHPNHPSTAEEKSEKLSGLIEGDASGFLGEKITDRFSILPFLLKVLDVRQMLSIQVHPSKESAASGFAKENKKGIPVTASNRNYKDENHKPELMVALSDFWLLHGFKREEELRKTLEAIPGFSFLRPVFDTTGYKGLYEEVMTMDQGKVNEILQPMLEKLIPLYNNNELKRDSEDFWAARAAIHFGKDGNCDRGIFSIYFFNLVHLKRGEGIFQPQGMPHAYLEGQNVEVMANSDNVLRAGLTDKHIDVAELMKHVAFEATIPTILNPTAPFHRIFSSPAEEFELHQYLLQGKDENIRTTSAEIWLVLSGAVKVAATDGGFGAKKGESFFVKPETDITLKSSGQTELFRVRVPDVIKN
ncbi:MAG TPA: mannose-6-phosphate isomerase, class I [Flavisolibacter sp.]|nr:mannose-6-phosphate isomerase, class I [Flavisolibacter sp.]